MKLFLDDDRNPIDADWMVVRTVPDLMALVDARGDKITAMSFDNDLRQPEEGWMAVREIVDRRVAAEQDGLVFLPELCSIAVHSANVEASRNMIERLRGAARAGYFDGVAIDHRPATSSEHNYPLASEDTRSITVFAGGLLNKPDGN